MRVGQLLKIDTIKGGGGISKFAVPVCRSTTYPKGSSNTYPLALLLFHLYYHLNFTPIYITVHNA